MAKLSQRLQRFIKNGTILKEFIKLQPFQKKQLINFDGFWTKRQSEEPISHEHLQRLREYSNGLVDFMENEDCTTAESQRVINELMEVDRFIKSDGYSVFDCASMLKLSHNFNVNQLEKIKEMNLSLYSSLVELKTELERNNHG